MARSVDPGVSDRSSSPAPASASSVNGSRTARRKSGRVRKEIQRLDPSTGKAKRAAHPDDEEDDSSSDEAEDDGADEEFKVPTSIKTGSRKRAPPGTSPGPAPRPRAPRARKAADQTTAPRKRGRPRAARASGDQDDEDEGEMGAKRLQAGKDFKIASDNDLYNAVKNPDTALQTTAEDWIESYRDASGPAMAELVNFVLRCCGCNATVDEHQAEDDNGIVENLKDIVDEFKQEADLAYPLVSRSKTFRKFRESLAHFLQKLLSASAEDILFSTSFYEQLQAWVHAMSSSQVRALRHTATVIVLQCVTALSLLHVQVRKEHAQALRAKEAEEKKSRKDKARLRDMERQVKEAHERLEAVEAFMEESYTSVFVNRYRDADAVIRAECISALGSWMKVDPDHWIDGDYLRYIGWVLSDESKEARRESVRALSALYQKDAYLGKLHHFTDRFKQQLVDMAVGEHDAAVRIQALQVVRQVDRHGLLEDEKPRDEVAMLVFEKEPRVRAAAATFFKGLIDEEVEEVQGELEAKTKKARGGRKAKKASEALATAAEYKVITQLLVKYGKALDGAAAPHDDEAFNEEEAQLGRSGGSEHMSVGDLVASRDAADGSESVAAVPRGRVAFAVDALWSVVDSLQDWVAMLEYALKDHSTAAEGATGSPRTGRTANASGAKKGARRPAGEDADEEMEDVEAQENDEGEDQLPEEVRLSEEEETLFLEVLLACLSRFSTSSAGTKRKDKDAEDEQQASVSRAIIEALPKLFAKNQAYPTRMIDVLALPRLVSLDLYLEGQQTTAYEALWDDVTKQFLRHTHPDVIDGAARTIVAFLATQDLSATNQAKMGELEETLLEALRAAAGEDAESASFSEDQLHTLTACVARLRKLSDVYNLSVALEETDDGKHASALDTLDAVINRGRLGYREESPMIESAIGVVSTHVTWQLYAVSMDAQANGEVDLPAMLAASEKRQTLLDKLEEFAVGGETNATEGVKRTAITCLLTLYTITRMITSPSKDSNNLLADLQLTASEELQARCAGYFEAEIERYMEELREAADEEHEETQREAGSNDDDGASSSGSDTETERSQGRFQRSKGKGKKKTVADKKGRKAPPQKGDKRRRKTPAQIRADNAKQQAQLISALRFERVLSPFVRIIHSGAFELRHSAVLLKYWGRISPAFDEQSKLLLHDLRDEGNYGMTSDIVASIIVDVLKAACDLYIDAPDSPLTSEEPLVSLGRQLSTVVAVRGAQLAIIDSLPAEDHLRLHLDALKWIVPKIAHLERTKRKEERNRALVFFKALAHLLLGLDGRSALKVKTALDGLLDQYELQDFAAPTGSKVWEPVRAYQRRLITAMSRDPSIARAAARDGGYKSADSSKAPRVRSDVEGKAKDALVASDDDDQQAGDGDEDEDAAAQQTQPATMSDDEDIAQSTASGAEVTQQSQSQSLYGSPARRRPPSPSQELFGPGADSNKRRRVSPSAESAEEDLADVREESTPTGRMPQGTKRAYEGDLGDGGSSVETGDLGETQTQLDEDSGMALGSEAPRLERESSAESSISLSEVKGKKRRL